MRAFTVHRPWAWAIAHAGKDVENRNWKHHFAPGTPIAIHAGKKWDAEGAEWISAALDIAVPPEPEHPTGVVAVAKLGECLELATSTSPWAIGEYCWQLTAVRALPTPIAQRGKQGIFSLPPEVVEQLAPPEIQSGDRVEFEDLEYGGGLRTGVVRRRGHPFLGGDRTWIVSPDDGGTPRFLLPNQMKQISFNPQ
jgi:hypothetical protein